MRQHMSRWWRYAFHMILHADGNSFYASCEQIFRPDLRNRPVVVLSNNDGVIVALNREAKDCGLKRGDVFFKVKALCEQHGVAVFSSNYTLYADISRRITSIYMEYAPLVEEYSIDESFLFFDDLNLNKSDWEEVCRELKKRVGLEVGMPICVGAAPTKTLAKLYNKRAKEHGGVFVYSEDEVDGLLESTDVSTVWNVGPSMTHVLHNYGIWNALQLKHLDPDFARKKFSIRGMSTVMELNGKKCIGYVNRERKEVVTTSRQFGRRVYDLKSLEAAAVEYAQLAGEKLRMQNCEAGIVTVFLSTCSFSHPQDKPDEAYSNSAFVRLFRMSNYNADFASAAVECVRKLYRNGFGYRTVMVSLMDIKPEAMQGDLFLNPEIDVKKRSLMRAVDKVNARYGRQGVQLCGSCSGDGWQMKRGHLSPCYTTRFVDLPVVR